MRGAMGNLVKNMWSAIGVDRSPLLADFQPEDRVWWRFLLAFAALVVVILIVTLIFALGAAVVAFVVMIARGMDPDQLMTTVERFIAGEIGQTWSLTQATFILVGAINAVAMLLAVWIASLLTRKPLRLSFTTARRWRWRQLFGGLVIYSLAAGALLLYDLTFGDETAEMPVVALSPTVLHMLVYVVVMTIAGVVAAGAEELVFRGWLLRHSASLLRYTWVFLLLNGVLFSAVHLDPDPNAFLARTAIGIGLCWMALRFGGIEFATGAHAANNILILLFIEPLTLTPPPPEPFSLVSGGEVLLMLALMIAVTEFAIRVRPVAALIGAREAAEERPGDVFG